MRLLNVTSFSMREFEKAEVPEYAILSHVWIKPEDYAEASDLSSPRYIKEITYQTLPQVPKSQLTTILSEDADENPAVYKIAGTCAQARQQSIEWIWMDTCCIDKSNGPEVAMSINSMFAWYRRARICYVLMLDVVCSRNGVPSSPVLGRICRHGEQECDWILGFKQSLWFKRGWTLQELLAPKEVVFYDRNWESIGCRDSLASAISEASGISGVYLSDFTKANIATKMSWASDRVTTVEEDMAYCLLGIFGISMDLRHGEGRDAFLRLQENIVRRSHDESIFAWTSSSDDPLEASGMLAPWPSNFKHSKDIVLRPNLYHPRGPYELTNQGLRFPIRRSPLKKHRKDMHVRLQCWSPDHKGVLRMVAIKLRRRGYAYERIESDRLHLLDPSKLSWTERMHIGHNEDIYISQF